MDNYYEEKEQYDTYEAPQTKTLLKSKRQASARGGKLVLDKIEGASKIPSGTAGIGTMANTTGTMQEGGEAAEKSLINLKNVKLTKDEQNFTKDYRRLEDLEREKGIKFFQCVGDEPHTEEFT